MKDKTKFKVEQIGKIKSGVICEGYIEDLEENSKKD